MPAEDVTVELSPERVAAAIKATEYKYFGDYEMSDDQREAVDVLVAVARQCYAPVSAARHQHSASTPSGNGEDLARRFHEAYERLAPAYGYETRRETRQFDPASANGRLMIAVCTEIATSLSPGPLPTREEVAVRLVARLETILEDIGPAASDGWASGSVHADDIASLREHMAALLRGEKAS